jgi:CheY-like chemotaxis protein
VLSGLRRQLHGRRDSWQMEFVTEGAAALKLLDDKEFDVVISDMCMPVINGAAVLCRATERSPGAARIMLSGQTGDLTAIVPGGAHRFVDKPCPVSLLELELEQALVMGRLVNGKNDPGMRRLWSNTLGSREMWREVLELSGEPTRLCLTLTDLLERHGNVLRRVAAAIAEARPTEISQDMSPRALVERAGTRDVLFACLAVEAVDTVLPGFEGPWLTEGVPIEDPGRSDGSSLSCLLSPLAMHFPDPEGLALLSWLLPGWGFPANALEAVLACTMGSIRLAAHLAASEGR